MTGFGAGRAEDGGEEIAVEARSVNHKFIEVKVRAPRELAALEPDAVRLVKERLGRGAVEVTLRRHAAKSALAPRVDVPLAKEYATAFAEVARALGRDEPVPIALVLEAEGVVALDERGADLDAGRRALSAAMAQALDSLGAMREREGAALARDVAARLDAVEAAVARLAQLAPQSVEHYAARLHERIAELAKGVAVEPARLAAEVAVFADRSDVAEELTRLGSHLAQMRGLLASREPAGRKMDFLVQEMNREVNTVGSKSQSAEIAGLVVELKAEIERMREQVQNVE